jgi:two-component system, chemotaxis family, protein-glutamate methylesterase/glutaminase
VFPAAPAQPLRVLIVDDSRFVRRVLRSVLERSADFVVAGEAADGEEGLTQARALRPDVISLDLDMPKLNGLAMLRQLRRESDVPVVLVTGLPALAADDARAATELKVGGLVVKTFSDRSIDLSVFADELIDTLREAWAVAQSGL